MEIVIMKDVDAKLNSVCAIAEAILDSDDFQVKKATKFLKELRLYAVDCFDKERTKLEEKFSRKVRGDCDFDSLVLELNATRQRAVSVISALETELEFYKSSPVASSPVSNPDRIVTAKLPKLQIQPFNGDPLKFNEFWQLFEINVHKNSSLSTVEKFNYLVSFLSDSAKKCIGGMPISAENYESAVQILKEKYGNLELLVNKHYTELTNLPRAKYYASSLRSTYEETVTHLRCLENLGEDIQQKIFRTIIYSKFPSPILLEVEKYKLGRDTFTNEDLLSFLRCLITVQENVDAAEKTYSHKSPCEYKPSTFRHTTENLALREDTECLVQYDSRTLRCFFCNCNHWTDECPNVTTLGERKQIAKGCCFNCFNRYHTVQNCPVDRPCYYCRRRKNHHRALCPQRFPEETQRKFCNRAAINEQEVEQCGMAMTELVTMQTDSVKLRTPSKTNLTHKVRELLGSKSQRTYLSEEIKRKLDLPTNEKEILSLHLFGKLKPSQVSTSLAELDLEMRSGDTRRNHGNVVPTIMGKHVTKHFDFSHLNVPKDVVLADEERDKLIELLIDNDYHFDVFLNVRKQLSPGLYLVNSIFCWFVSGRVRQPNIMSDTVSFLSYSSQTQNVIEDRLDLLKWIIECPNPTNGDLAVKNFNESKKAVRDRYFVPWPWKFYPYNIPSECGWEQGCLKSPLVRILQNQEHMRKKCNEALEDEVPEQTTRTSEPDLQSDELESTEVESRPQWWKGLVEGLAGHSFPGR